MVPLKALSSACGYREAEGDRQDPASAQHSRCMYSQLTKVTDKLWLQSGCPSSSQESVAWVLWHGFSLGLAGRHLVGASAASNGIPWKATLVHFGRLI